MYALRSKIDSMINQDCFVNPAVTQFTDSRLVHAVICSVLSILMAYYKAVS